jgi:DNA polymerase III delta subunit
VSTPPRLAYLWGEDAFGIGQALRDFASDLASAGEAMTAWRTDADEDSGDGADGAGSSARRRTRTLDAVEERLATAPLFGGGTLVVVRQPGSLAAESTARDRLLRLIGDIPPGNALCFTDLVASGARGPSAKGVVRDAVAAAGGLVRELAVPPAGRLEGWLVEQARLLGATLQPDAARLLAQRVGGHVREADVDRRRRTELAHAELEKLALYRVEGPIATADVEALVPESIPGSMWAFLDAFGARSVASASRLAERVLADGTPMPLLIAQVHRRLRDLVLVREHLDSGSRNADIVRSMRLQPFRAQKLAEQARTWAADELFHALDGLLELDLRSKGVAPDGGVRQMSDAIDGLALQVWLASISPGRERSDVARPGIARPAGLRA